jgi:Na+-transporting NADH:ubiquinone oxidoreductase subunit C
MRKKRWFAVFYMFTVTAFFSSIIIGLSIATRDRVKANEMLALERAVLQVLPGLYEDDAGRTAVHRIFTEKVVQPSEETGGAWAVRQNGKITAYAVPVAGQGFWAPIKGVIGVQADRRTVTGIAFYEQNETPGLGAIINTEPWKNQFKGKKLALSGDALQMRRPGDPLGEKDVHAVTGATQTSVRAARLINSGVAQWRQNLTD